MIVYLSALPSSMPNDEAIEFVTDRFIGALIRADDRPLDAELLVALREGLKGLLRVYRLTLPSDAFLDDLVREMCEWHDIPLAGGAP
jgi:hypothetical protein